MKTHNKSTVLPNYQVYEDTASVCQRSHSIPEQRNPEGQHAESSLQKTSLETRLGASELINTNNTGHECYHFAKTKPAKVKSRLTTQNMNTATKLTKAQTRKPKKLHKHPQERMIERKPKDTQRSNRVPCGKVQVRIINMKQDTRQSIIQEEMNNSFRKSYSK